MILWSQKTLHPRKCEMKISPAILINKKCHWPPNVHEGSQNWDPGDATTPHVDCWGAERMQEARLAPDSWGAYERNEFSEPRGLHLPIHRMLNSLTWYWYLMFSLPASFVANLYIAWLPLLPPWSSFPRVTEMQSPRLTFPPNKIILYFQIVTIFF